MVESRAQRVAKQLGMSQGSAVHKLRKSLLFEYVSKANDNVCFVCGDMIEKVEDFSIEHKKPWENRDPVLFWARDNIAFSHLSCNRPHSTPNGGQNKIQSPQGMLWCSHCKKHKLIEDFSNNSSNWSGKSHHCKQCNRFFKGRA
jgi:hypothetical protein